MECYLLVCLLLLRFSIIRGVVSVQDVTEKLNGMNTSLQEVKSSISDVRSDVVDLEERFDLDLKFAKLDLKDHVIKTIVPTFVRSQVERALEDILRTRSVDILINSHVMTSLQRLKKAHRVLKNSLQLYVERVSEVERENRIIKAELAKVEHSLVDIRHVNTIQASDILNLTSELNETRSVCRLEKKDNFLVYAERFLQTERENIRIKAELTKVEHSLVDSRHVIEFQSSEILNLTLELNETRTVCSRGKLDDSDMATVRSTVSSFVSTVVSSESQPQYNMSRVLYVSYNSVSKQLSLKINHLQTFPLQISNVKFYSVVFEPTSRKIIFSVGDRNHNNLRICSSDVEGGAVKVVRYGIRSRGLTVDTTRNVIFMTTGTPTYTISRMRPDGSEYRVVADVSDYRRPYNIAVAPDKQLIYSAHANLVIETSYDGVIRQTIDTGRYMFALDYDNISHKLYYTNDNILKRWSPGNKESIPIHKFTDVPLSLKFYRNSVYIGYYTNNELGVVFLNTEGAVYWKLADYQHLRVSLCLIP